MKNYVKKFSNMIRIATEKMASGEKATPEAVISATGATNVYPDNCCPSNSFLIYGYCDPYFGWLVPAMHEASLVLETELGSSHRLAAQLWSNKWTRAFLIALYERNDEKWELGENVEPELTDKLGFNVRTREGFIEWILSGELYGYNLPGHGDIRAMLDMEPAYAGSIPV